MDFYPNPLQIETATTSEPFMILTRKLDHYLNPKREIRMHQKI